MVGKWAGPGSPARNYKAEGPLPAPQQALSPAQERGRGVVWAATNPQPAARPARQPWSRWRARPGSAGRVAANRTRGQDCAGSAAAGPVQRAGVRAAAAQSLSNFYVESLRVTSAEPTLTLSPALHCWSGSRTATLATTAAENHRLH